MEWRKKQYWKEVGVREVEKKGNIVCIVFFFLLGKDTLFELTY